MVGQVRGFDLDEFLSDWEPKGEALPGAVGDGGWVSKEDAPTKSPAGERVVRTDKAADRPRGAALSVPMVMSSQGLAPYLKVLFVPDYVPLEQRVAVQSKLYVQLSQLLPGHQVHLAVADGPFEDDHGVGAHFEALALG